MKIGETVTATVTIADYSMSGKNYMDTRNCPMACMAKRVLGTSHASVSAKRIIVHGTTDRPREEYKVDPGFGIQDFNALENGTEKTVEITRIS